MQAPGAVPADVGLLVDAEGAPLWRQLQEAHEQLAAQKLQIQVGVAIWAVSACKSQLGPRPVPAQVLFVPKILHQTVTHACHQVCVLTAALWPAAVTLMP